MKSAIHLSEESKKALFIEKKTEKALAVLEKIDTAIIKNKIEKKIFQNCLASAYFEAKDYEKAAKLYKEMNEIYQYGFCQLLLGNIKKTHEIWSTAKKSEATSWGNCLINFIQLEVKELPTFLQIRNHLEMDLCYFIEADQIEYAENLIACADVLASINIETYKFIGRALLNKNFDNLAIKFLLKSKEQLDGDPEIYYYLALYSYNQKTYKEAQKLIDICLKLSKNNHYPAFLLAKKLKSKL